MDQDLNPALKEWVKGWTPPPHSPDFDERMVLAYRRRLPWWKRLLRSRVEVPLPAFAAVVLLLIAAAWLAFSRRQDSEIQWRPVSQPRLRVITAADVPARLPAGVPEEAR